MYQSPYTLQTLQKIGAPQERDYSNNVLVSRDGKLIFLPAYLRMVFMEVEDVNIKELTASFYTTLMLTVYYKNIPLELMGYLNSISFSARNVEIVHLIGSGEGKNCTIRKNSEKYTLQYVYKGRLPLRLECDVSMTPFEVIDFKLMLDFHPIIVERQNKVVEMVFNFMDIDDTQAKFIILYRDSNISGSYGLCESSLVVENRSVRDPDASKQRKQLIHQLPQDLIYASEAVELETYKDQGGLYYEGRIQNWRFATYYFKMYNYPINTLITIFVPLWILSLINLVTYWSDEKDVSHRLDTISVLMVTYAALLPTIRDKIPPSPTFTLFDYMLYALSFTIFLSTLDTLIAISFLEDSGSYTFIWHRNWRFLLSMIISISTIVILVGFAAIYKCVWQPRYNFTKDTRFGVEYQQYKVDTEQWHNSAASNYLKNKTEMLKPDDKKYYFGNLIPNVVENHGIMSNFPIHPTIVRKVKIQNDGLSARAQQDRDQQKKHFRAGEKHFVGK